MDPRFSVWLGKLETAAERFRLETPQEVLADARRLAGASYSLLLAGEALRTSGESAALQSWTALLVEALRTHLAEGVTADVLSAVGPAQLAAANSPGSSGGEPEARPLVFLETLAYGTLRRDVLQTLALLSARRWPLLVVLLTVPPRPPAAQEAVLAACRLQLQGAGVAVPPWPAWDPELPATLSAVARGLAAELQRWRERRLRSCLLQAQRQTLLALRATAESQRCDLAGIERSRRELQFEKERLETRLSRARRTLRAYLEDELPRQARPVLDRFHAEVGALTQQALQGAEPLQEELQRVAARAVELGLCSSLPGIVARSVAIFSEETARQAAAFTGPGGAAGSALLQAATDGLSSVLRDLIEGDEILPSIRAYHLTSGLLDPVIRQSPQLRALAGVLGTASQAYVATAIAAAIEALREPLRERLALLATALADAVEQALLRASRAPIEALETTLRSVERRLDAAHGSTLPAAELVAAIRAQEILGSQLREP